MTRIIIDTTPHPEAPDGYVRAEVAEAENIVSDALMELEVVDDPRVWANHGASVIESLVNAGWRPTREAEK